MSLLGKTNKFVIVRDSDHGFYLDAGPVLGEILLPARYIPELEGEPEQGDEVEVFVYNDSEDRPVATPEKPIAEVGQYAEFTVVDSRRNVGAFLDWGLPKDLLLPYREQSRPVRVGEKVVARVMIDERSGRIVATMKFNRFLHGRDALVSQGEEVTMLCYDRTDLGYLMIVNEKQGGMLFYANVHNREIRIGEKLDGYVGDVRPDGKVDLLLEKPGYNRVSDITDKILEAVIQNGGSLPLGDKSPPEAISERFGISKKAFKQALGSLYKKRKIVIGPHEIKVP